MTIPVGSGAVTIPLPILTPLPTIIPSDSNLISLNVDIPETTKACPLNSVAVANPEIFASPRTSSNSVGTVVPIPTKPVGLTTKLSSST